MWLFICNVTPKQRAASPPTLQYISVDNATALCTCENTLEPLRAGSLRPGQAEAINQTNSITAWRRKHSNR